MRSSTTIPAGTFFGGEIEPGTFHRKACLVGGDRSEPAGGTRDVAPYAHRGGPVPNPTGPAVATRG